jgi:hypothetical protein
MYEFDSIWFIVGVRGETILKVREVESTSIGGDGNELVAIGFGR